MRRLGGSGGRRGQGHWRPPAMLAVLFGVLAAALCGPGGAAVKARQLMLWDYWGREKVTYSYRLDLSKNDAVCPALLEALNHPRPGDDHQLWRDKEERPADSPSLYRDPLFLRWHLHGLSPPLDQFADRDIDRTADEWMTVPLFNDGRDVAVVRQTAIGPTRRPETPQVLYVFEDLAYFEHARWDKLDYSGADKHHLDLFEKILFVYPGDFWTYTSPH